LAERPLTLAEAAATLGVHYMTVYRYVRTGKLPARLVAGTWQVDPAELAQVGRSAAGAERLAPPPGAAGRAKPAAHRVKGAGAAIAAGAVAATDDVHGAPPATERDGPRPGPPARRGLGRTGRLGWQGPLEARLVAGDEAGAWAVIEAVLAAGAQPDQVLLDLIAPAMRSVGTKWAEGRCSIADEHRATAVTSRLLSRLGSRFARPGVKRPTVVLAALAGDLHSLPVSMAANLLRWHGFQVVELGADTPPDAVAEAATAGPLAIGIVSTATSALVSLPATIAAVRHAGPGVAILLGGGAISGAAQARRLGADAYTGVRADGLVRAVEAIAAARP
jgi:excisionase family DNA binding protein